MAVRSRQTPELRLRPRLDEADAGTDEVRDAVVLSFALGLYGDKAADVSKRQALLLGEPELDYLATKAIDIARSTPDAKAAAEQAKALFKKEEKSNLSAMRGQSALAAGLEAALFGRMVTSDPEANTDAAVHVAHAFTVHAEATESDYFTVVDDLTREAGEAGTAGLFDTELTAGLFYGYVVLNLPLLISNLGGDSGLAGKVAEHLVHLIATVSPGAKKGSNAERAREVWERDVDLDALEELVFRDLLTHMMEDPRNISFCAHLLFCSKNIERIGDHATNIAETVVYLVTGETMPSERPHGRQETDIDIEAAGGDV